MPLLATKLYIPQSRPDLVSRPRLFEQLNIGLTRKLTLISAPAGFGKSTLVSAWVQQAKTDTQVAWLSLDEGDNDLNRFLIYFVAALQTIDSDIGQGTLVALQLPGTIKIETVLTTLINEIAEFSEDVVLILDDYHVIESQPIDQAITFLLDHLPSQFHLVIASRIDPTLPLSRLRARGQMTEIRANDLRFTPDEAAAFLHQVMNFDLPDQYVAALGERTEGWISGLQLAALSMQGLKDSSEITDFVNRFTGSDRYIQDYLADEVLQQQPKNVKDFLLQTSLLTRMSAPLCDAVCFGENETLGGSFGTGVKGVGNSQEILEGLEASNLFIVPLDNERCWYRYHHLFADLLRHNLRQTFPARIPELHGRASDWYENEGFTDDAVYHAQVAGDNDRIGNILEKHWQEIVHRGEFSRLKHLLDSLGAEYTRHSPPLSMAYCWIYSFTGAVDLIPSHLKDIRSGLKVAVGNKAVQLPIKLAVIPSLVETMEAIIALENNRPEVALVHAKKAISLVPEVPDLAVQGLLKGAAGYRLAEALLELEEYDQASAILLDVLEILKFSENYIGAAATILQIVDVYRKSGRSQEAVALCEENINYIEEHNWGNMSPSGIVYVILADLQADSREFTAARKNFEISLGLAKPLITQYIPNLVERVEKKLNDSADRTQPLVESLSERELEVLQLIAQGLTNREISERLYLALDTVKGHNRRVFRKLGVQNRTEAVTRARELGLL